MREPENHTCCAGIAALAATVLDVNPAMASQSYWLLNGRYLFPRLALLNNMRNQFDRFFQMDTHCVSSSTRLSRGYRSID